MMEVMVCMVLASYCYGYQMKEDQMDGVRSTHWMRRNAYKVLVVKAERKRFLGRTSFRHGDSIQVGLKR